jgi:hypothetical protein
MPSNACRAVDFPFGPWSVRCWFKFCYPSAQGAIKSNYANFYPRRRARGHAAGNVVGVAANSYAYRPWGGVMCQLVERANTQ